MVPKPFTIDVPQDVLDDLHERLARTRWPDEVDGAGWDYGTNLSFLQELATYWREQYDWRAAEAKLNEFSHFRAEVDGFGIHFIHERANGPNRRPLLLLHGWPDSFYRYSKIVPMLSDSFDVVVPSLPGFGFSDKPTTRAGVDTAELLMTLMTEVLGYSSFAVHGGDTGSPLAKELAARYPETVSALHLTDIGWDVLFGLDPSTLSPAEKRYLATEEASSKREGAYIMVQGTKPQTLAYGLTDSPVGMAAWIVEKFHTWSDCGGELERSFTKDELLTNIMIYWVTETFNASIRWYYFGSDEDWSGAVDGAWADGAAASETFDWGAPARSSVPAAVALFPEDLPKGAIPPRELGERFLNVVRWTEMPRGGHFAALEEPELLVEDMRAFFGSLPR